MTFAQTIKNGGTKGNGERTGEEHMKSEHLRGDGPPWAAEDAAAKAAATVPMPPPSCRHSSLGGRRASKSASQRRRFSVELSTEALFRASASDLGLSLNDNDSDNDEEEVQEDAEHEMITTDRGDGGIKSSSAALGFHGAYADIRRTMIDYSYHVRYRKERQWLHDSIIVDILESSGTSQHENNDGGGGGGGGGDKYDNNDAKADESNTDDGSLSSSSSSSSSAQILECATRHCQDDGKNSGNNHCCEAEVCHPWLILTAGPQGAGKRYTVEQLVRRGQWSFSTLVVVDSGECLERRNLPFGLSQGQCSFAVSKLTLLFLTKL
jgi:hypothetical protein